MKNYFDTNKTIVAISSPMGAGGISVVRMSGENAISIADKMFVSLKNIKPSKFEDRKLYLGNVIGGKIKERCLCVVFVAPNSFTGDNLVEFQCHGGIKISEAITVEAIEKGAVLAENGEFSMRAFLNGKMSLAEAEGMMDMINAESDAEVRAGYSLMSGELSKQANIMQQEIIDIMSDIEVSFDYPENDIEYATSKEIVPRLEKINENIKELLKTSKTGSFIKNGINVLIVGKPNVGKSSVLNAIVGREKAIVTEIAGTTRDLIEDNFEYNGIKFNITDTAGIHETQDIVEALGVKRAKEMIKQSDIVLFVIDNSEEMDEKDKTIFDLLKNKNYIIVANKSDKTSKPEESNKLPVSAKTGKNIEKLKQMMYDSVIEKDIVSSNVIITNARHKQCLENAMKAIESALASIKEQTLDVISIDIMDAYQQLGEITGTTSSEEIINSIFSKFCLGK